MSEDDSRKYVEDLLIMENFYQEKDLRQSAEDPLMKTIFPGRVVSDLEVSFAPYEWAREREEKALEALGDARAQEAYLRKQTTGIRGFVNKITGSYSGLQKMLAEAEDDVLRKEANLDYIREYNRIPIHEKDPAAA